MKCLSHQVTKFVPILFSIFVTASQMSQAQECRVTCTQTGGVRRHPSYGRLLEIPKNQEWEKSTGFGILLSSSQEKAEKNQTQIKSRQKRQTQEKALAVRALLAMVMHHSSIFDKNRKKSKSFPKERQQFTNNNNRKKPISVLKNVFQSGPNNKLEKSKSPNPGSPISGSKNIPKPRNRGFKPEPKIESKKSSPLKVPGPIGSNILPNKPKTRGFGPESKHKLIAKPVTTIPKKPGTPGGGARPIGKKFHEILKHLLPKNTKPISMFPPPADSNFWELKSDFRYKAVIFEEICSHQPSRPNSAKVLRKRINR